MSTNVLTAIEFSNNVLLALFIGWIGLAIICAWFADRRGRPIGLWALLGFTFGVFALVIILVLPNRKKPPAPPPPPD